MLSSDYFRNTPFPENKQWETLPPPSAHLFKCNFPVGKLCFFTVDKESLPIISSEIYGYLFNHFQMRSESWKILFQIL